MRPKTALREKGMPEANKSSKQERKEEDISLALTSPDTEM
jgi:hypothetical protein